MASPRACHPLTLAQPRWRTPQNPPDWQEILTYFRGSELQNYFMKVLEDNLKVRGASAQNKNSIYRCIPL